jgi:hypothetical protein
MSHSYGGARPASSNFGAGGGQVARSAVISVRLPFLLRPPVVDDAASPCDLRSTRSGIDGLKPGFHPTYARFNFTQLTRYGNDITRLHTLQLNVALLQLSTMTKLTRIHDRSVE